MSGTLSCDSAGFSVLVAAHKQPLATAAASGWSSQRAALPHERAAAAGPGDKASTSGKQPATGQRLPEQLVLNKAARSPGSVRGMHWPGYKIGFPPVTAIRAPET